LRADWQKIGAIAGKARDRALRVMAWRGRFPTRFRHSALNREPRQTAVAHRVKARLSEGNAPGRPQRQQL